MRYLFLALVALNIIVFGYYSYFYHPKESSSVAQARTSLINPVQAT